MKNSKSNSLSVSNQRTKAKQASSSNPGPTKPKGSDAKNTLRVAPKSYQGTKRVAIDSAPHQGRTQDMSHRTSNPNPIGPKDSNGGATLAVGDNARVRGLAVPYHPPVKNESPAVSTNYPPSTPARVRRVPGQAKGGY